ncbi:Protein kinase superfamily protein [Abeliophyllum distichum]|uniref:Protein kinase superfamily protein n=1 Tax=Abeliophyllum distichum TaxID=126358 RepID=A0ABD1UER8_9LAMI
MTCFSRCFSRNASSPTRQRVNIDEEISGIENAKLYSYKELQIATDKFNPANKIGEGGFGSVYKGKLNDGTLAAVKVLSAESQQGVREFLTEIVVISGIEHENLVKLYGCCAEGDHRILVYGYLENNSLSQTLLGGRSSGMQFSWKTRTKICVGVARGIMFLHEEIQPHIVHRDIKASNILLDKNLNPKISDFGLAKLFPENQTHISTRVAGTIGYMAPEYASRGQLTRKADIYSFGVLLMEVVSGRSNTNKRLPAEDRYILKRAWRLYEEGNLVHFVDSALEGDFDVDEACKYLKIGLLCTQEKPNNRPSMSIVVRMMTGEMDVDEKTISRPGLMPQFGPVESSQSGTSYTSSHGSGKQDKLSSSHNTTMTYATMTFTSIYDRSN